MDWKYLFTSYEGRIGRASFWMGIVVYIVGAIVATIIDNVLGTTIGDLPYGYVYVIYGVVMLYPIFSIYAKRWHDRNKSGWWTLIALVPFIGALWLLIELGFLAGTPGPNRFGQDPVAASIPAA